MINRLEFLRSVAAASLIGFEGGRAMATVRPYGTAADETARASADSPDPWIRPGSGAPPIWGIRGGIQVGMWPASLEGAGEGGPRGLLRIGYPILDGGRSVGLVNFLAIEPLVKGKRGFSELERSSTDGKPGRQFWSGTPENGPAPTTPEAGTLSTAEGVESLTWTVQTERFASGARPVLQLRIRADRPGELSIKLSSAPGSAAMDSCVVTATMGNYMRLRRLWLSTGAVRPESMWPRFNGREFTGEAFYGCDRMVRMPNGDLLVCATTNERDPHSVPPNPVAPGWAYRGSFPLTQYWRKPASQPIDPALQVRVNGRRLYWASHNPIPGGLAYENFDLLEPFTEGQELIFGLTRRSPADVARGRTGSA